jgi:xylulokinase
MIPALLGIDVGTSSVKVVALGTDGAVVAEHAVGYETAVPQPGWAEQDPEAWWRAVGEATRALLARAAATAALDVVGIGLSGQMHTFVLVDRDGRPVRPAVTWMDTRAAAVLPAVRERIAAAGLRERLANPAVLGLTLPPLVWLSEHEPESLRRTRALLSAKDYVRLRLTGEVAAEATDASATLLCDVGARAWSGAVMAAFDLPADILPPLGESHEVAGRLGAAAAEHLGLRAGLPVAFGAGDQQAAALGMGSVRAGQVQLTVGTGAQVIAVRDQAVPDAAGRLHTFCHVRGWITQASVNNAGSALSWVREVLGVEWDAVYDRLGAQGAGPTFVPYLAGERTPLMKGHVRGAWIGLEAGQTRADLARAAGEGVVAAIAEAIGTVLGEGAGGPALRAAGGGMRHAAFAQSIADASGHGVEVREARDASGIGAALLAGIAAGVFDGYDAAAASAPARIAAEYAPDPTRRASWAERRTLLRALDASGFHEIVRAGSGRHP